MIRRGKKLCCLATFLNDPWQQIKMSPFTLPAHFLSHLGELLILGVT